MFVDQGRVCFGSAKRQETHGCSEAERRTLTCADEFSCWPIAGIG